MFFFQNEKHVNRYAQLNQFSFYITKGCDKTKYIKTFYLLKLKIATGIQSRNKKSTFQTLFFRNLVKFDLKCL